MNITIRADLNGIQALSLQAEGFEAQKIFDFLKQMLPSVDEMSPEQQLELKLRRECAKVYVPGDPILNSKIAAIKAVREITHWGLKEAKDWVESKIG